MPRCRDVTMQYPTGEGPGCVKRTIPSVFFRVIPWQSRFSG